MDLFIGKKMKRIKKELQETKILLDKERKKSGEEALERQELEIRLWRMEGEVRNYQYRENRVKDHLKYEYWNRLSPLYTMDVPELECFVRLENLFHDTEGGRWGVVECYCIQCGKALQARYFDTELEALRYMAVKQILGISPVFDTCMECYQRELQECA